MDQNHIDTWQRNIVYLMDMFNKSEDKTMLGLTLKYAADYFSLRNKEDVSNDLAEKSKKLIH